MENKVTIEEFDKRLNWTLNQKIDHSLYIIDSFISQYPNSLVSFSGGIDSTIMLFLVRMLDKNKKGLFVNTTNEHVEIIQFIKRIDNIETILPKITFSKVVEQYGFPLISKEISQWVWEARHTKSEKLKNIRSIQIPDKWKFIMNAPFNITHKCCDILKKRPMQKYNKDGIFIGTMASESRLRKFSYLKTGCINLKQNKATPLSIWTKQDIWKFQKQNKIEYCDIYDKGESSTGCAYCGFGCQFDRTRFLRLKYREPKRFIQMMNLKNNGITYAEALKITLNMDCSGTYIPSFFPGLH